MSETLLMAVVQIRIEPHGLPGHFGPAGGRRRAASSFSPMAAAAAALARATGLSPRELEGAGLATLLFDLLTERRGGRSRQRVRHSAVGRRGSATAVAWARRDGRTGALPIGLFGASTGAAAALLAAATTPAGICRRWSLARRPAGFGGGRRSPASQRRPPCSSSAAATPRCWRSNRVGRRGDFRCERRIAVVPGADAFVRGTRHAGTSGRTRARLVPPTFPDAAARLTGERSPHAIGEAVAAFVRRIR